MNSEINNLREFGKFRLDPTRRVLWFEDKPVNLQPKEVELLCVLTENGGEVVSKEELMDRVWEDSFVEESNLSRRVYGLRKTFKKLGAPEDLIQTVPRRGYRFTGNVSLFGGEDLVIERHSFTRTLIEELDETGGSRNLALPALSSFTKRLRFVMPSVILLIIFGASAGIYLFNRSGNNELTQPIRSVAVLPLKSLNTGNETALSLGFADALITSLGKLNELQIVSTNAVSRYADEIQEPIEIGRKLRVEAVLDGTLQRANGKFRVSLRLLRVADGKQIWTGIFDESESKVFELQDAMAKQTAQILALSFETDDVVKRPTTHLEAYNSFLQGEYYFRRREISKAGAFFKKAIEIDSKFAEAWSGLAAVYAMGDAMGEAEPAVTKALELKPDLGHAHAVRGFIKMFLEWNWVEAERSLSRAVELDPNSVEAHHWRGIYLAIRGRFTDAKSELNRALELDPLSANMISDLGQIHYFSYDFASAENYYLKANVLSEGIADPRLVDLYQGQGRNREAFKILRDNECRPFDGKEKSTCENDLEELFAKADSKGIAQKYFNLFSKKLGANNLPRNQVANAWYGLAVQHRILGNRTQSIASLEKTLDRKVRFEIINFTFPFVAVDPQFDELRGDPKFLQLLKKVNL